MDWLKDVLPLLGVVIGSFLTRGNQRAEKVADLRRAAYGTILAELAIVETRLNWVAETIAENENRYFQGDGKAERTNNQFIGEHMAVVRKRFVEDYLILSEPFIARYEKMIAEMDEGDDMIPPMAHDCFDGAIRRARPELLAIAKREVAPRPYRWLRLPSFAKGADAGTS